MNNSTIIFNESIALMNEGKIKGTGQFLTNSVTGEKVEIPEPIHTYKRWQALGFQVKKGQKAVASFTIWKCSEKKAEELENAEPEEKARAVKMFMKKASFFTLDQVEPITAV